MARPLRIEYPGALYHVISRGIEKKDIFQDSRDRMRFLGLLEECCERFGIIIYCYVLMSNHYHILLVTTQANLNRVMHWLNTCYASYFNYRYKRNGPLFQGRYKAILVDKDHYLLELTRYIHLNPYKAGIVKDPAAYRWSTYRSYLGKAKEVKWVDYSSILAMFGKDINIARNNFKHYVDLGKDKDIDNPMNNLYGQIILGDKPFVNRIKEMVDRDRISPEIPERRKFGRTLEPEQIFTVIERTLLIQREHFLNRGLKNNLARKLALYMLKKYTHLENREIAALFGDLHYTTIAKQFRRFEQEIQNNNEVKDISQRVKRSLSHLLEPGIN